MADIDPNAQPGTEPAEMHQPSGGGHPPLTANQGVPVSDDQNSLKAGPHGPVLLEDFVLRDSTMGASPGAWSTPVARPPMAFSS